MEFSKRFLSLRSNVLPSHLRQNRDCVTLGPIQLTFDILACSFNEAVLMRQGQMTKTGQPNK